MAQCTQSNSYQKMPLKLLSVAITLMFASSQALAQDSGLYGGLSIGKSLGNISSGSLSQTLQPNGFSFNTHDSSDRDTAWKILAGYDFNRYLATELTYFDLGNFDFGARLNPAGDLRGKADLSGIGVDVVATLPFTENLSGLFRAGMSRNSVKQSFSSSNATPTGFVNRTSRESKAKVGVGLQYDFSDALSLRAEWEQARLPANQITDSKVNLASVGMVYRFGRTAAPAPVVPASAPAPAPAPAPTPAPQPVSVTLAASALFDFDDAALSSAGRQELDQLIRQINGLSYEAVVVIGHTDRIGTRDYNLGLSQRRADAVRAYLVQGGIAANRITARGVANDEPVTPASGCRGLGSNAATIACLAPDRRVVVEIDGSRNP
ncbi:MAG: OmpA family protein [Pseudohongiella sp.]|nr:OmpA family protein [Pseudohongiella sp.]